MLFNNEDFDFSFLEIHGTDFKLEINQNKFLNPSEGFLKGNLISDEYQAYKNHAYCRIRTSCEREALLLKVMEYSFALNDLNLYLDVHPLDTEAYHLFQEYVKEEKKCKKQYTELYGPLVLTDDNSKKYEWSSNPWPWDLLGGDMYV